VLTKEYLATVEEIKFPDPFKQMISDHDLESQAQIIIPSVVFSEQGTSC